MCWRKTALLVLITASLSRSATIHLKTRDVETTREASAELTRPVRQWRSDTRHLLARFTVQVNQDNLLQLAARGVLVTGAVDAHTVMLNVPDTSSLDGLGIEWSGNLKLTDKLSPEIVKDQMYRPAYVVNFHADVLPDDAARMVLASGLMILPNTSLLPMQFLVLGSEAALVDLASWDEVAYIFPASDELLQGRPVMACAGALSQTGTLGGYVKVGTGWAPDGPSGATLKYVFTTLTTKVPNADTMSEIRRALNEWSRIAKVQFVEGSDPSASRTIAIEFGTSVNGDPVGFDGPGGVLAHTYYPAPPNTEPIAGDMHFDPSEDWRVGTNIDVYTVALHELGHAIGLGHSDHPGAVMYPYYHYGAALTADDIAGAQSLYGAPIGALPVVPPSTPTPPPTPVPAPVPSPVPTPVPSTLTLTVLSPAAVSQTSNGVLAVSGQTGGGSGTVIVTWQSNAGTSGRANGGAYWSATGVPLIPGDNSLLFTAVDATGKTTVSSIRVTLLIPLPAAGGPDLTPPSLTLQSPSSGTVVSDSTISLSGTASDNVGVTKVSWQTGSGASGLALGMENWTASGVPLFPGNNVIVVRAYDAAGNSRFISLNVTRK